jgi:hypothetical protein
MENRCDNCKKVRSECQALVSTGEKPTTFEIQRREMVCAENFEAIDLSKSIF